jgi:hypothetical protein
MPVNIDNNKSTRFYYFCEPDDEIVEWIEVKPLLPADIEELNKKYRVEYTEYVQPRKLSGKIDKSASIQKLTDYRFKNDKAKELYEKAQRGKLLTAWQLYKYADNGELELIDFTPENIESILNSDIRFIKFFNECISSFFSDPDELEKN